MLNVTIPMTLARQHPRDTEDLVRQKNARHSRQTRVRVWQFEFRKSSVNCNILVKRGAGEIHEHIVETGPTENLRIA